MKVSVRVAHSRNCPNHSKTALESVGRGSGCTCHPSYYTFHRQPVGGDAYKPVKGKRVRDKRAALEAAARRQSELDRGKLGFDDEVKRIMFPAWVDLFEETLEGSVRKGDLKARSKRDYMDSLHRARKAIGYVDLRHLGPPDLRRFDDTLAGYAAATRARHLKHLSLALNAAVGDGYAATNPIPAFKDGLNLSRRIPKRGKGPFEDGELARLWVALDDPDAPMYRYVAEFSAETGMRIGELAALDWPKVSLQGKTVEVDFTWNDIDGLTLPKDGESRTVYMTPHAVKVLEGWVAIVGVHNSGPVFPNPAGGRLSLRNVQRRLETAMEAAAVPKRDPRSGKPRSFHSFRYSFSNIAQRRGYHPRLIEATLGHSNLELTYGVYGGWTPDQLAAEAARIEA